MQPTVLRWRTATSLLVCLWSWQLVPASVWADGKASSAADSPRGTDDAVVARVGETDFKLKDIRTRLAELPPPYRYAAERRLPEVLKEIIEQQMLWHEARRLGLERDPAVQRQIQEATRQILTRELFNREIRRKAFPTDEQVRRYYAEHPAEFGTPERQGERHILVPTQEEATAVLAELRAMKDFDAVAKGSSREPEGREERAVQSFTRGQRDAETERVAFGLKVGETGGPVRTPQGYLLIKVVSRHPADRQPLELAKPVIQARLQPQNEKKLFEELLGRLRSEQKVEIYEDVVRAAMPRETKP